MESDTPRTNKNAFAHYEGFCVSIAFARELERELNETRVTLDQMTKDTLRLQETQTGYVASLLNELKIKSAKLTEAQAYNNKITKELWMWKHGEMRVDRLVKELNATRAALEQMTEDAVRMRNLMSKPYIEDEDPDL